MSTSVTLPVLVAPPAEAVEVAVAVAENESVKDVEPTMEAEMEADAEAEMESWRALCICARERLLALCAPTSDRLARSERYASERMFLLLQVRKKGLFRS